MKPIQILIILAFSTLAAIAAPKNIDDYFLEIPRQGFTEGSPTELLAIINRGEGSSLIDKKNGYIRLEGDGAQVSLQIALFRYDDNAPLLAVAWGNLEEPDFTHVTFFIEKKGKMIVADRTILPVPDSDKYRFGLPQFGRTIIVRDPKGKIISRHTWSGTAFKKD